jgi:hypothetical protein
MRTRLGGIVLLAAGLQANAAMTDTKLLDMLLANGSITQAQHDELAADLAREQKKEDAEAEKKLDKSEFTAFQQLSSWATGTQLRGDLRVREDYINVEDERKNGGRDKDRQRIRARLGAFTQVNPTVEVGIQVATGNDNQNRSTNQDLDNFFTKKDVWLDLGYVDVHPQSVPGLKLLAGKMRQPWTSVADAMWDTDINPEGFAAQYQRKNGSTTLFGSASYLVLKDNVDGDGVEFDNDLALYALQAGITFDLGDARMTFGGSINDFNNEDQPLPSPPAPVVALRGNGNTTDEFSLYEGFSTIDIVGLPLPLSLYGQYIKNDDDGGEDTAWLLGFKTNVSGVGFDYNYRDVEANAVVGTLTDSDFAAGFTNSRGHKLKAQYDFLKNCNLTVTWFLAESDAASRFNSDGADVDTVMIDLNAKFP